MGFDFVDYDAGKERRERKKNNTKKKQEIIQIEFDYKLVDMRSMGKGN